MKRQVIAILTGLLLAASTANAAVWFVSPDGNNSTGDGGPANPFGTIQHGLDMAFDNDTLYVVRGTYIENINPGGKNVALLSIDGPELTIIQSAAVSAPVAGFESGESRAFILDGFTIANAEDAPGILCDGSSPTIRNCIIRNCHNDANGGGIACVNNSGAAILSNDIWDNSADGNGGGIYCASSSPELSGNAIASNTAANGGGLYLFNNAYPVTSHNLLVYNHAFENGGAVASIDQSTRPVTVEYCTMYQNRSDRNGGAVYAERSYLIVETSIMWEDIATLSGPEIYTTPGLLVVVSNCNLSGGWIGAGSGNSDIDPMFCDVLAGDFHLQEISILSAYPFINGDPIGALPPGCMVFECDDIDEDGICDEEDNCPEVANADQADADDDGIGDLCDNCPDASNADQADADADGYGDLCDNCPDAANADQADSDGDGYGDLCDNCPDVANADQADADGDGIGDLCDNCPDVANADQADTDADGYGDLCDNCPDVANADQADADGDGYGDLCDNCPEIANADQADADGDGYGDLCDNCPDVANADQADTDADGFGDLCDNCPDAANADQADSDGDGIGDACTRISEGSISGFVFLESAGMVEVLLDLYDSTGTKIASAETDQSGAYFFPELISGTYTVVIWPPFGYNVDEESRTAVVEGPVEDVNFNLFKIVSKGKWRGKGYWLHQVRAHLYDRGYAHETYENLCGYLERIRIYFNQHPEYPVLGFVIDENADCNQRLVDLEILLHGNKSDVNLRARAAFAVLLLNLVSGKIPPWVDVNDDLIAIPLDPEESRTAQAAVSVSQAVTYCDILINDGLAANDNLAYNIANNITEGELVEDGWIDPSTPVVDYLSALDADNDDPSLPDGFELGQNYPNPFNPVTRFSYTLAAQSDVRIVVYNMLGQPVRVLVDGNHPAGVYDIVWNATDDKGDPVASGIYYYKIVAEGFADSRKMMLLK